MSVKLNDPMVPLKLPCRLWEGLNASLSKAKEGPNQTKLQQRYTYKLKGEESAWEESHDWVSREEVVQN